MDDAGDGGCAGITAVGGLRQESRATGVVAGFRQADVELGGFLAQKSVRHLDQNAGAVTELGVVTRGTAVCQIAQDFQALGDDIVAFAALDVCYETNPARVFFVCRIV
jgi:hypothetical protein